MDATSSKLSRTEIAMRVRATVAERVACPVEWANEGAVLRGTGAAGSFGFEETDVLDIISNLERALGIDLLTARAVAFEQGATIGQLIDLIEGSVSGGTQ
jgi:hypothetical protein